jgi:hypothetical protein
MMRLQRASLLVALSLLTWWATAHAECAWVLCNEVTTTRLSTLVSSAEWLVISADPNKNDSKS